MTNRPNYTPMTAGKHLPDTEVFDLAFAIRVKAEDYDRSNAIGELLQILEYVMGPESSGNETDRLPHVMWAPTVTVLEDDEAFEAMRNALKKALDYVSELDAGDCFYCGLDAEGSHRAACPVADMKYAIARAEGASR